MILGRVLGVALGATLRRAWVLRSGRWLALAGVVLVLRVVQRARHARGAVDRARA